MVDRTGKSRPPGCRFKGAGIEIYWQHEGRPRFVQLDLPQTAAGLRAASAERERRKTLDKLGLLADEAVNHSFGTIAQDALDAWDGAPRTRTSYRDALNRYWFDDLAAWPISQIGVAMLRKVRRKRLVGVSLKTQKNAITAVRYPFRFAMEEEVIDTNPALALTVRRHASPEPDPLDHAEAAAVIADLWAWSEQTCHPMDREAARYFEFALEQGMRTGELLGLQWPQVDHKAGVVTVDRQRTANRMQEWTKTNKVRTVLLTERGRELLASAPSRFRGEFVFVTVTGRGHVDADEFSARWHACLERLGIRDRVPYQCRHTYCSLGLMDGMEPGFLASQTGHSLTTFFKHYAKWIRGARDQEQLAKQQRRGNLEISKSGKAGA